MNLFDHLEFFLSALEHACAFQCSASLASLVFYSNCLHCQKATKTFNIFWKEQERMLEPTPVFSCGFVSVYGFHRDSNLKEY